MRSSIPEIAVGAGRAKDEKAPLSEIIRVLNERFGASFAEDLGKLQGGEEDAQRESHIEELCSGHFAVEPPLYPD
jgi:hypothetical protein